MRKKMSWRFKKKS